MLKKPETLVKMYKRHNRMESWSLLLGIIGMNFTVNGAWLLGVPILAVGLTMLFRSVKYDVTVESSLRYMDEEVLGSSGTNALEIYEQAKKLKKELKEEKKNGK